MSGKVRGKGDGVVKVGKSFEVTRESTIVRNFKEFKERTEQ